MNSIIRTGTLFLLVVVAAIAAVSSSPAGTVVGFKVLHSFTGADGGSPNSLIQASDGFFYGSAANGGDVTSCPSDGCGVLFRSDSTGHITVLHRFHATDGYVPTGLVKGADGNFYGTTISGGQPSGGGGGTLFRMDIAGNVTVLYAFVGGFACCDGAGPSGPPIQASDGNFYGTTGAGGAFRDADHPGGFGTVYQFNPVSGQLTILHSFNLPDGNGIFPNNPLLQASDGLLYGTTTEGAGGSYRDQSGGIARHPTAPRSGAGGVNSARIPARSIRGLRRRPRSRIERSSPIRPASARVCPSASAARSAKYCCAACSARCLRAARSARRDSAAAASSSLRRLSYSTLALRGRPMPITSDGRTGPRRTNGKSSRP